MERRKFIKLSSTIGASCLLPIDIFGMLKKTGLENCLEFSNRKLVLIQLAGANDGLNTLVPVNQYDSYANLRPTIKLNNSGANGIINLDNTLSVENQIGLHPSLSGFKELYENGFLKIIQGVGYPNINKSHFKSTDLWLSGGDGNTENFSIENGWIGRFIEKYYSNSLNSNYPIGIQMGSGNDSILFHGNEFKNLSISINNRDSENYYSAISGLSGNPPEYIPDSEYGEKINHILSVDNSINSYSQSIIDAFNNGQNSISYADNDLSNQLKTVAKFISGGLKTNIYLVTLPGFDTHESQVISEQSHLGDHASLLNELSTAMNSFMKDINNQGFIDDVIAVTFSEFGRKAKENSNLGTDHGEVAPMFVFGKSIKPGIIGTNVNLNEPNEENNYQLKTIQFDYRNIFSAVLQDWFGAGNTILDMSLYDRHLMTSFKNSKTQNIFKDEAIVPLNCYKNIDNRNIEKIILFPNPCKTFITVTCYEKMSSIFIYSMDGKLVYQNLFNQNLYQETIFIEGLLTNTYLAIVELINGDKYQKKIIKL